MNIIVKIISILNIKTTHLFCKGRINKEDNLMRVLLLNPYWVINNNIYKKVVNFLVDIDMYM